jgi:hypothetical protein
MRQDHRGSTLVGHGCDDGAAAVRDLERLNEALTWACRRCSSAVFAGVQRRRGFRR